MNAYRTYVETNDGIVIFLADATKHVLTDNPLFQAVKDKIASGEFKAIPDLVDTASRIKKYSGGRFWVDERTGVIVIDGTSIPEGLSARILEFTDLGLPTEPLTLFWDLLQSNPSEDARDDLFGFLAHNDIPMTKDGKFLAYKRVKRIEDALSTRNADTVDGLQVLVRAVDAETGDPVMVWEDAKVGDLVDIRTATIRNNPGDRPFMPRDEVNCDRNMTCSAGLHVAAYRYADQNYYHNGDLLEVLVDPRLVVAVPQDYNGEKMRVSEYEVSRIAGLPRTEPLAFTMGAEVEYTSPDTGDKEEVEVVKACGGHPNRYDIRFEDGTVLPGVAENDLSWPSSFDAFDDDDDDDYDYGEDDDDDDDDDGGYGCGSHDDDDDDQDDDNESEEDVLRAGLQKLMEDADKLSDDAQRLMDGN